MVVLSQHNPDLFVWDFCVVSPVIHKPLQAGKMDWVLANLNVSGYYRVNYDIQNWERLLNQLTTNHQVQKIKQNKIA